MIVGIILATYAASLALIFSTFFAGWFDPDAWTIVAIGITTLTLADGTIVTCTGPHGFLPGDKITVTM